MTASYQTGARTGKRSGKVVAEALRTMGAAVESGVTTADLEGLALTIEPFLTTCGRDFYEEDDGWSLRTTDGSVGAPIGAPH
ncbi:MAG: hypothetical protein AB8I08_19985 [Sandaracinaceae bacterium]